MVTADDVRGGDCVVLVVLLVWLKPELDSAAKQCEELDRRSSSRFDAWHL
jgi:hypothetical protein